MLKCNKTGNHKFTYFCKHLYINQLKKNIEKVIFLIYNSKPKQISRYKSEYFHIWEYLHRYGIESTSIGLDKLYKVLVK
ncbi:hypothetical protein C8E01_10728 [Pontibacter virosus]|uniref:Uncharacterized protein n=1 Tax=Pontibacter virosus TaxID=1765052 RepID=A0A2U1AVX9_9BACT|nr:hypothetical protein C8E01_10728 [Pontibacter virosus]